VFRKCASTAACFSTWNLLLHMLGLGSSGSSAAVSTPDGQILPAAKVCALFEKVGFTPPEDIPLQDAFDLLMAMMLQQSEHQSCGPHHREGGQQ